MADTEPPPKDTQNDRTACTECARRKQKCNREWPCNHCQKRKVADRCRFKDVGVSVNVNDKTPPEQPAARKRERSEEHEVESSNEESDNADDFEKLGYAPAHAIKEIKDGGVKTERRAPKEHMRDMRSCPPLKRAVDALPPRPYTDSLVQNFFSIVNFHYYIIYPDSFFKVYKKWWDLRTSNSPLSLQWTCLLLQICACSAQYVPEDLHKKLNNDLGASSQQLTEKYHGAAKDLRRAIPVGSMHLLNVQSLLHSCYWHRNEAQFVESWHVLSSAIREAQELGIDKEGVQGEIPEVEREQHRRVWVVMDTWDWQISALLSRPMIIDRSDIDVGLPSLTLENFEISPLLQMKMQSELITKLSKRFGLPKNVTSPQEVQEYQKIMDTWMTNFPPPYDFKNPDTSSDVDHPWVVLHRHYLHTMSYSMALDPIRAYLAKPMNSKTTPSIELEIRRDGVDYAIKIMNALYKFFDYVWPRDAKFHFVIFCIFDTAALYSSVIMHDEDNSVPRRREMLEAMDGALGMVKRLAAAVPAAGMYHNILQKLYKKTLRKINGVTKKPDAPRKKARSRKGARSLGSKASAQVSTASVSSFDSLPIERNASSTCSTVPRSESQLAQAPMLPPEPLYNFNATPFIDENYVIPDSTTLYNGAACVLDGGGGLPPLPTTEFTGGGEFVDPGVPDLPWASMSEEELGPMGELWRWQSMNLGMAGQQSINPAQLDLANGAYAGFHGGETVTNGGANDMGGGRAGNITNGPNGNVDDNNGAYAMNGYGNGYVGNGHTI